MENEMKKIYMAVMIIIIFSTCAFAAETVLVEIPNFDVRVNGQLIDTEHSQYPVIRYKGITYFPMTSDYLSGIGLNLKWSQEEGIAINQSGQVGAFSQNFLGSNNTLGSKHYANIATFPIKVNGSAINNSEEEYPVLLYKDITYFPMTWRFAVTEFGWETNWDNETGFGIIVGKGNADTPIKETTESYKDRSDFGQRNNPARFEDSIAITSTSGDGTVYNSVFILSDIIRDDKAWKMIYAANSYNDKPAEGYEYLLAKFSVNHYDCSDPNKQLNLSSFDFTLVSQAGKDYDSVFIVEPDPSFDAKLFQGASHEGYVVFLISKTDSEPLIAYNKNYDGTRGVWFRGYKNTSDSDSKEADELTKDNTSENSIKPYMTQSDFALRSNPVRMGDEVDITTTNSDGTVYKSTFILSDVVRGSEAWKMIYDANSYNDKPAEGYEYLLVKFSVNHYGGSDPNKQLNLSGFDFTLVSQSGKDYDSVFVVEPEPSFDAKLFQGASHEGYAAFLVSKSDVNPLIAYCKNYDGTGGIWFTGYDNQ
jgi:hypothetical protein